MRSLELIRTALAGPQILLFKTLNLHMARPYPKRAAGVAMINALGGLANLWSSYLYYNPPAYYTAFGTGRLRLEFWKQNWFYSY